MKSGSKLEKILEKGEFAVTAEIGPPKQATGEGMRKHARALKDCIDAANITDCQTAIARLSSIAGGMHLMAEGVEPIVQMTCRDRNRLAIQADLMGAYSLGVKNVLCLSGDHQRFGNHPESKNVYDVDSMHLIKHLKDMRDEKKFFCGEEIKANEPRFYIGAVANPFADPFEFRVMRLEKKVEAGADFIQTQCIFDMERFDRFMEMVRERGIHERTKILAGLTPFKSWQAARYVGKNVSGMLVPDEFVERMKKADDPKEAAVEIIVEQINHIKNIEGVHGVHIMAIAWEEIVPTIVEKAGLSNRPRVD